jgi:hypothetical protein
MHTKTRLPSLALAALALASLLLFSSPAQAAAATHPGFGRARESSSLHSGSGQNGKAYRKGLRARAAVSFRGQGKKVRVCKETYSEFVCSTQIVY